MMFNYNIDLIESNYKPVKGDIISTGWNIERQSFDREFLVIEVTKDKIKGHWKKDSGIFSKNTKIFKYSEIVKVASVYLN